METFKVGERVVCNRDPGKVAGTVYGFQKTKHPGYVKYLILWDDGADGAYYRCDLYECR